MNKRLIILKMSGVENREAIVLEEIESFHEMSEGKVVIRTTSGTMHPFDIEFDYLVNKIRTDEIG